MLLEALKRQAKEQIAAQEYHRPVPAAADDIEDRLHCLRRCLEELPQAQRELVAAYYRGSGADRIEGRRRLAQALGIGMNALRIRAFRLSDRLQGCVTGCVRASGMAEMER